jgi:hypothetical protein
MMTYNEFEAEYEHLVECLNEGEIDADEFERLYDDLVEQYGDN